MFADVSHKHHEMHTYTHKAPFSIDPKTGIVNVSRPLDISESEKYSLTVEVSDGLWMSTVKDDSLLCGFVKLVSLFSVSFH